MSSMILSMRTHVADRNSKSVLHVRMLCHRNIFQLPGLKREDSMQKNDNNSHDLEKVRNLGCLPRICFYQEEAELVV